MTALQLVRDEAPRSARSSSAVPHQFGSCGIEFVRKVMRVFVKRHGPLLPPEDLESLGMMGFLQAMQRFSPDVPIPLYGYAYLRTMGAMVDGARRWSQRAAFAHSHSRRVRRSHHDTADSRRVSENFGGHEFAPQSRPFILDSNTEDSTCRDRGSWLEALVQANLEGDCLLPGSEHTETGPFDPVARKLVLAAVQALPSEHQRVLEMLYVMEFDAQQVAELLGCSRSWVCRLHGRILADLRKHMASSPNRHPRSADPRFGGGLARPKGLARRGRSAAKRTRGTVSR